MSFNKKLQHETVCEMLSREEEQMVEYDDTNS